MGSRIEGDQLVRNSNISSAFLAVASYGPLIKQFIQLLSLSTAPLVMTVSLSRKKTLLHVSYLVPPIYPSKRLSAVHEGYALSASERSLPENSNIVSEALWLPPCTFVCHSSSSPAGAN
eukprot:Em0020g1120a